MVAFESGLPRQITEEVMKELLSIISVCLISMSAPSVCASENSDSSLLSNRSSNSISSFDPWTDPQPVAWENAFINQNSTTATKVPFYSNKLFGQRFDVSTLFKREILPKLDDPITGINYFEIDSRIKGDWGDITLSFENSHLGTEQPDLLSTPIPSDQQFASPTKEFAIRTNGHGRLRLSDRFSLEIELEYLAGDSFGPDGPHLELPTLAYSADLNSKFGNLNTRTVYFHMDRNHDFSRYGDYSFSREKERGFRPLYILTGTQADIFSDDIGDSSFSSQTKSAGIDGIAFIADYKASPRIKLHTAIGAANADKTPLDSNNYFGWEANIGLGYKILDNLTYELHLGYMATGDFFKSNDVDVETEDMAIITQHLTLKF